jgi:NADPH2:quinone reductase
MIVDAVGGSTFGLEHVAGRGVVVNLARGGDDETVIFRERSFDRARGARICTLNLFDDLAGHGAATADLIRLATLVAEGRLDGQIEFQGSWRDPAPALTALLERRIGGKAVLDVDRGRAL